MSDFPLYHGVSFSSSGQTTANSYSTTVTSSVTAHTKGSWTQIAASIPDNAVGFWLFTENPSSWRYLLDVGVGAGPTVLVPNLAVFRRAQVSVPPIYIPITLPATEALSIRCQSGGSAATIMCSVIFAIGAFPASRPLGAATDYGSDTANSRGTTIDPGAVANTKGSWTQITAATTEDIRSLILMVGTGYDTTSPAPSNTGWLFDVGVGGAGSEQTVLSNVPMTLTSTTDVIDNVMWLGPLDLSIPTGTRIAVRAQSSSTDATYRYFRISLLGLR